MSVDDLASEIDKGVLDHFHTEHQLARGGRTQPQGIRYSFARGTDGGLVDVRNLSRDARGSGYSCIACGASMIPKLGEVRSKHFAHLVGKPCSSETYLHRLAKECFAEGFKRVRQERRTWRVMYPAKVSCSVSHPSCPDGEWPMNLALFDQLQIEAPIQGCIADVLLTQSSTGRALAVEIWVTHECDDEKVAKGFPILEVKIEDEAGALSLASGTLSETQYRVLNFPTRRVPVDPYSCKDCPGVDLFVVYRSGKPILISRYRGKQLRGSPVFQQSMGFPADCVEVSGGRFFEGLCLALEEGVRVEWRPPDSRVWGNLSRWLELLPDPVREQRIQLLETGLKIRTRQSTGRAPAPSRR